MPITKLASKITGCYAVNKLVTEHSPLSAFTQKVASSRMWVHKPGLSIYLTQNCKPRVFAR